MCFTSAVSVDSREATNPASSNVRHTLTVDHVMLPPLGLFDSQAPPLLFSHEFVGDMLSNRLWQRDMPMVCAIVYE